MTDANAQGGTSDGFWAHSRGSQKHSKKDAGCISKFRQDPTSNGLNYEKIHDARSKKCPFGAESIKLIAALF